MAGGITPKAQPLDLFPIKIMKGCYRDFYDIHMITSPVNPTTGYPTKRSRQLCAKWVVEAWDKVSESLTTKAWKVSNHKNYEDIQKASENMWQTEIVDLNEDDIVESMIGMASSIELVEHYLVADNSHPDDEFDDDNVFALSAL